MEPRVVDWSEMCSDAIQLILESLSFPDFHRARTVCSSWYSVSKSCVAGSRNRYPWLMLFREKSSVSGSCKLLDPFENKTYKTRDLGNEFHVCRCIASYGNWLLMLSPRIDFSIINVFTGEKINLPSLSLQGGGEVRFRRKDDGGVFLEHSPNDRETIINRFIKTAVLWIDEETKDFVVCWNYQDMYLFSYKKGNESWWHLQGTDCLAMAYKYNKLFVITQSHYIKILDFSDDFPNEIIHETRFLNHRFNYYPEDGEQWTEKIAITTSGDVVIIVSIENEYPENEEGRYLFKFFKMNVEGTEWARVYSLDDEMMLVFGDGFIKSNSIYFITDDVWPAYVWKNANFDSSSGVYDLATTKISWSRFAYCLSNIRWFVPGSDKKYD
ncbi:hypothetical protein CARUB_v10024711mg [Capsella rubella]|uniref:F-box domain-containing protein n=1 Tax=Capsella rubella TaxID=81985 RepID=R0HWT4_9BRAS|nr:putative F-box protein At2g33200 [Capsella rubella]EOA28498.1 hypothetical protein CARUB_v10024711mg [Capsella rubella]